MCFLRSSFSSLTLGHVHPWFSDRIAQFHAQYSRVINCLLRPIVKGLLRSNQIYDHICPAGQGWPLFFSKRNWGFSFRLIFFHGWCQWHDGRPAVTPRTQRSRVYLNVHSKEVRCSITTNTKHGARYQNTNKRGDIQYYLFCVLADQFYNGINWI